MQVRCKKSFDFNDFVENTGCVDGLRTRLAFEKI